MQETTKKIPENECPEPSSEDESSWGADQREKSYYYDDSYGYEVYEPAEDEAEEDGK